MERELAETKQGAARQGSRGVEAGPVEAGDRRGGRSIRRAVPDTFQQTGKTHGTVAIAASLWFDRRSMSSLSVPADRFAVSPIASLIDRVVRGGVTAIFSGRRSSLP